MANDVKMSLQKFIQKLLDLVPPYDKMATFLWEYPSTTSLKNLAENYPEYTSLDVFSLIQRLFGMEIKSDGTLLLDYTEGRRLGRALNELIKAVFETFDDDCLRKELSQFIGQKIQNPLEEYVKACIETIDKKALEILKLLLSSSYEEEELRNILIDKGIAIDESELRDVLSTLLRFGLIKQSYNHWSIVSRVKRHLEKHIATED